MKPFGEIEFFVNRRIGPHIVKVNRLMRGADAVYAPEPLYQPDRVPVQVVVQDTGAVLEVLPLGYYVRRQKRPYLLARLHPSRARIRPGGEAPDYADRAVSGGAGETRYGAIFAVRVQLPVEVLYRRFGFGGYENLAGLHVGPVQEFAQDAQLVVVRRADVFYPVLNLFESRVVGVYVLQPLGDEEIAGRVKQIRSRA